MGCTGSTLRQSNAQPHSSASITQDPSIITAIPDTPHFIKRFINKPCLKPNTLKFLKKLQKKNKSAYDRLINELNLLCDPVESALFFKPSHFDTVIHHLDLQSKLNPNIMSSLTTYLVNENPNIRDKIKTLRMQHLPDISTQAHAAHLVHHTLKHASEIKKRAMRVITEDLGLFSSKEDEVDIFLRTIIGFIIECHDHEQTNPGLYDSVELATAARVTEWLTTPPSGLPNLPSELINLIQFLTGYLTPLGTTMVYSPISTMDLSALYTLFETTSSEAGIPIYDNSNANLIKKIRIASLITGVCDKTPAAIFSVVKRQTDSEETNSLTHLEQYQKLKPHQLERYTGKPLIQAFFENTVHPFQAYYPSKEPKYNYQAFLMALIPKLGMEAEFSVTKTEERDNATSLGDFIKHCQTEHKNCHKHHKTDLEFLTDFELQFEQNNLVQAVEALFFNEAKIKKEKEFCLSQANGLMQVHAEITDFLKSNLAFHMQPLIDSTVPMTDKDNLEALYQFYLSLNASEKKRFIQEITLNMVLQAGTIYLEQPTLEADSEAGTPIETTPRKPTKSSTQDLIEESTAAYTSQSIKMSRNSLSNSSNSLTNSIQILPKYSIYSQKRDSHQSIDHVYAFSKPGNEEEVEKEYDGLCFDPT